MSDKALSELKIRIVVAAATTTAWRNSEWMCILHSKREINRPKGMS